VNKQEQREYDLQKAGNYDELNAWIHRTGKAFIITDGGYDPELFCQLMAEYDLCPAGMFSNRTLLDATSDAMQNAYRGQLSHVFEGPTLIKTWKAVKS
jgi:hypothetical protein